MAENPNVTISWFVQSYYKPYVATAILTEPLITPAQNCQTSCKVRLCGLKPCDINYTSTERVAEVERQQQGQSRFASSLTPGASIRHLDRTSSPAETDYLNLHIKPLSTSPSSHASIFRDNGHEASPIRVTINETSRGRHRICVSQTLLRAHNDDI